MPITEFVIPSLKQDDEARAAYLSIIKPGLSSVLKQAPGLKQHVFGKLLLENGLDISTDLRPVIAWEHADNFFSFILSVEYKAVGPMVKPHALAPSNPQLYETDVGPRDVFATTLTEVWQVKLGNEEEARYAWRAFITAVKASRVVKSSSGTSLNQEEKQFLGIIGWDSVDAREEALREALVVETKASLDALVSYTFVVSFSQ